MSPVSFLQTLRHRLVIALGSCLVCMLSAVVPLDLALAQAAPREAQAKVGAAGSTRFVLPLSRLAGHERPVRLSSTSASTRFSLPMPALWQAEDVKLELVGTVSLALNETSQLEVSVNGRVVHQFRIDGRLQNFRREIAIAAAALHDGFNEVQVTVAQHYTDKCEYPMAPQLWTEIDIAASRFVITASPKAVPTRLDRLDALFDKAVLAEPPIVSVLTAAAPSAPMLSAMGLVAQGIGERFDYVPVRLATARFPPALAALGSTLPAGARGAVVIGTFEQLESYLQGMPIPAGSGPVAALRQLPGDAARFVLVLAAQKEEDLPVVATALAMQRMPWPDREWVSIAELKLPPPGAVTDIAAALKPSTDAFPLSALGYSTATFSGVTAGGASLRFWNGSWQGRAQIRVHLSYGSGMSAQSALNVMANGVMHGSIPLDRATGGVYDNYTISFPTGALRPGWNTLELQPVLVPQTNGGDCKPFFPGNLAVTVYDDSTVQTFSGSPLKRPDLALLATDGRVVTTARVGVGMALQLTDGEDATVGAGLTLLAKLTQVFHGPLLRSRLMVGEDKDATNRLWVGSLDRLPPAVRSAAGLGEAGRLNLPVPLIRSVEVPVLEGSDTLQRLREALQGPPGAPTIVGAQVALDGLLAQHTLAVTVLEGGEPLTVFVASTPAEVQAGMHDVVGYGQWAQLRGGLALWRPGSTTVQAVSADDAPYTAYSLRGGLGLWVSQYPWWALLILVAVMALLMVLTRIVLASYRRRYFSVQEGQRRDDKGGA